MSRHVWFFALVCAAGLLLSGCLLKPVTVSSRRFILPPIAPSENAPRETGSSLSSRAAEDRGGRDPAGAGPGRPHRASPDQLSVGIASVKMPSYLMRNSMAIRRGESEIDYFENALWAERLDEVFQRTLAANLSTLLPSDQVYLSSWERDQVMVRVFVNVEQFDVDSEGRGKLIASWRITASGNEKSLKNGQTRLTQIGPVPHGKPQVVAATLSALIAEFSRQVAQAIHQSAELKDKEAIGKNANVE